MIQLLKTDDGRGVYLDGDEITRNDAIAIANKLLKVWGQVHPKARALLVYEVTPQHYSDCNHYETLEEGLKGEGYKQ